MHAPLVLQPCPSKVHESCRLCVAWPGCQKNLRSIQTSEIVLHCRHLCEPCTSQKKIYGDCLPPFWHRVNLDALAARSCPRSSALAARSCACPCALAARSWACPCALAARSCELPILPTHWHPWAQCSSAPASRRCIGSRPYICYPTDNAPLISQMKYILPASPRCIGSRQYTIHIIPQITCPSSRR